MAHTDGTRIQLCGRLVVLLDRGRVEGRLPGAKGRLLFGYLVLNRARRMTRDELLTAVYGDAASPEQSSSLSVLLSKLRAAVGSDMLTGRSEIELVLARDAFVDVEAAFEGIHRAETHVTRGEWAEAWGPAGVAYHVASRPLLQGHERSLARRVATTPRGHPSAWARMLGEGKARIGWADPHASRGLRPPAHRARSIPRDRPSHPDRGSRAAGQRGRGSSRL
jgi:hypothetical protein